MTIERKVGMGIAGQPSGGAANVADVFSTYLYKGNGSSLTINNGIDLAGEGGMTWIKIRNGQTEHHSVYDTERGATNSLATNLDAASSVRSGGLTSFNSNGFSVGDYTRENHSASTLASWTFRKKEKFFTCLTYTGNGVAGREISHGLAGPVGMMVVKRTSATEDWTVYHSSLNPIQYLNLNTSGGVGSASNIWNNTAPTSTVFTVGNQSRVNSSGSTYVAYLWSDNSAEDAEDQMIKCGSYTGDGNSAEINIGWEPQFVIVKRTSTSGNWYMADSMRGELTLSANSSNGTDGNPEIEYTSRGFRPKSNLDVSHTYIYMAIRAPMMVEPEAATDVFAVAQAVDNNSAGVSTGFASDMSFWSPTATSNSTSNSARLLGTKVLRINNTNATTSGYSQWDRMDTWFGGEYGATCNICVLKRAKGFMDCVAYSGNGSSTSNVVKHSLGVAPEIIMIKKCNGTGDWHTYVSSLGLSSAVFLNDTSATQANGAFTGGVIDSTQFEIKVDYGNLNTSGGTYIAYLFATLAGISKCGSYTGNGSSQTISCGFSAGSRFILIKRTDANGEWYWWDTVQGIVAGNDPYITIRGSAQVTGNDSVDPHNSGFIVNQVSATNINVSSGTYIFYAIA